MIPLPPVKWKNIENPAKFHHLVERSGHQRSCSTVIVSFPSPRQRHPAHFWHQSTLWSGGNIGITRTLVIVLVTTSPPTPTSRASTFTYQTSGLVYCISCLRCPAAKLGVHWGNVSASNFGASRKNLPGFPVSEHFNATGHSIYDVLVRGILLCGATSQRKQQEMRLIFRLN